jgi:hypothetical protein
VIKRYLALAPTNGGKCLTLPDTSCLLTRDSGLFPNYTIGERLDLEIDTHSTLADHTPKTYLKVEVVKKLGEPWRSGCVMLCHCLESPRSSQVGQRYVLKIVDPRLLYIRRSKWLTSDTNTFKRYVMMVVSGAADTFLKDYSASMLGHDSDFDLKTSQLSGWQAEAVWHKSCQVTVEEEISAYRHLQSLQGDVIPKFIHQVWTCPWYTHASGPCERYFQAPGFLIEYVDGITFGDIADGGHVPRFLWEELYAEAVRVVSVLEYYNFDHKSLAPRNIMVAHKRRPDGRPRVVLIDLHKHSIWAEEDGYFKHDIRWCSDMELSLYSKAQEIIVSTSCEQRTPNPNDNWFRTFFTDQILTGRFAERRLFRYPDPEYDSERRKYPSEQTLLNCLRWRVIMDDLWFIQDVSLVPSLIEEKARISRIAAKIMYEEVRTLGLFWECDDWYLRALPRKYEELDFEPDVVASFNEAFEAYCQRPNGPQMEIYGTFADTFMAALLHGEDIQQDETSSSTTAATVDEHCNKDQQLSLATPVTPTSSSSSTSRYPRRRSSCSSSAISTTSSGTFPRDAAILNALARDEQRTTKVTSHSKRIKIFIPKSQPPPDLPEWWVD